MLRVDALANTATVAFFPTKQIEVLSRFCSGTFEPSAGCLSYGNVAIIRDCALHLLCKTHTLMCLSFRVRTGA